MSNLWPPILESSSAGFGRSLSIEEWLNLPEDEDGELVEGRLAEEELPDAVHELTVTWLIHLFRGWLSGKGFVLGSELKVLISKTIGRKPDVVIFLPGSAVPPRRGPITIPPDIIIEVVTPSPRDERRDRIEKMAEYARFGVMYYWLVDPALESFEIFELTPAAQYQRVVGVTSGLIDAVPGCSGLNVDVDALWNELRRLAEPKE
jgi:Uma2 family endonuclease